MFYLWVKLNWKIVCGTESELPFRIARNGIASIVLLAIFSRNSSSILLNVTGYLLYDIEWCRKKYKNVRQVFPHTKPSVLGTYLLKIDWIFHGNPRNVRRFTISIPFTSIPLRSAIVRGLLCGELRINLRIVKNIEITQFKSTPKQNSDKIIKGKYFIVIV